MKSSDQLLALEGEKMGEYMARGDDLPSLAGCWSEIAADLKRKLDEVTDPELMHDAFVEMAVAQAIAEIEIEAEARMYMEEIVDTMMGEK